MITFVTMTDTNLSLVASKRPPPTSLAVEKRRLDVTAMSHVT